MNEIERRLQLIEAQMQTQDMQLKLIQGEIDLLRTMYERKPAGPIGNPAQLGAFALRETLRPILDIMHDRICSMDAKLDLVLDILRKQGG